MKTELKRALSGKSFLLAAAGMALCVLAAAYPEVLGAYAAGGAMEGEHRVMLLHALKSDIIRLAVPCLAPIPFAASFAEDLRTGFHKPYLIRTKRRAYAVGKALAAALSGGLAAALGIIAAGFALARAVSPIAHPGAEQTVLLLPKLFELAAAYFLSGCLWAAAGLAASALSAKPANAYAVPFIACYLLIIIQERYLRGALALNPKNWLAPGEGLPLGGWSAHLLMLGVTAILLLLFFFEAEHRLAGRPRAGRSAEHSITHRRLVRRTLRMYALREERRCRAPSNGLSRAIAAAKYDFGLWRGSARAALTFLLAFILCFLLSDKAASFAASAGTVMQAFEPFVWTFGDTPSILLVSLLLILLFADMPRLGPEAPYYIVRMDRASWCAGQLLYVAASTLIFTAFIFASTTVICMRNSFIGNKWSETAAILGYSGAGRAIVLPALVRTLEMSRPYSCAAAIFLLMLGYTLMLSLVMTLARLRRGRAAGIAAGFAFSLWGLLLDPRLIRKLFSLSEEQAYRANVAVGWLSPLDHAAYHMHSFGWDGLPKLWQTYLLFGLGSALLTALILREMRRFCFDFSGTETE